MTWEKKYALQRPDFVLCCSQKRPPQVGLLQYISFNASCKMGQTQICRFNVQLQNSLFCYIIHDCPKKDICITTFQKRSIGSELHGQCMQFKAKHKYFKGMGQVNYIFGTIQLLFNLYTVQNFFLPKNHTGTV